MDSAPEQYPETGLREIFRTIFARYAQVKTEPAPGHPFMRWFRRMSSILPRIDPALAGLQIEPGTGHSSNWSKALYLQFRQLDLAPQRKSGLSLAYFFSADLTAVFLSIYIGVENLSHTTEKARQQVKELRRMIAVPPKFSLEEITLGAGSAQSFEQGHVWGVRYASSALPEEQVLRADLEEMLTAYRAIDRRAVQPVLAAGREESVPRPAPPPQSQSPYSMEDLVADTLWTREGLEEVLAALDPDGQVSRQVILAGPPGTGKTWIAKKLVKFVTQGDASRSRFVQFHPSYSYEQFIEGLTPVAKDGAITFEVEPGIVLRLVNAMEGRSDRHYLIIDELNRANLPRVLGELMYLFEYRDEEIALALSPTFKLPPNLAFIGTMNTADRSIRSIDLALRRRFDIFECLPDSDILERFYAKSENENIVSDLKDGFIALNKLLEKELDRYHTIGHTFFMAKLFTADTLERVWKRQVLPMLAEYFFDQPDLLDQISLERFWPSVQ